MDSTLNSACFFKNLDGPVLRDTLLPLVEYWQFESKLETLSLAGLGEEIVYEMGNATGICSPANVAFYAEDMVNNSPQSLKNLALILTEGMFYGLGVKIPTDKLKTKLSVEIAIDSWWVVYVYYWSSFCLLIACSTIFMLLIRRHKADIFDRVSVITRLIVIAIGAVMIALIANEDRLYGFISSPWILPTCLILLLLVQFFDRISAMYANWRLKKSGEPYAFEDRGGHHGGSHGDVEMHDPLQEPLVSDHRKSSAAWSIHSDREPLTGDMAYHPPETYHMGPVASPPIVGHAPAGYAPVHHGHGQV